MKGLLRGGDLGGGEAEGCRVRWATGRVAAERAVVVFVFMGADGGGEAGDLMWEREEFVCGGVFEGWFWGCCVDVVIVRAAEEALGYVN